MFFHLAEEKKRFIDWLFFVFCAVILKM